MNESIGALLWGSAFLTAGFSAHVVVWRMCPRFRNVRNLILVFVAVFVAGAGCLAMFGDFTGVSGFVRLLIFYFSMMAAYVATYPALQADSPSLVIINKIHAAGANGLGADEIADTLKSAEIMIKPRIADLLRDGMVNKNGNNLALTPKGARFIRLMIAYRRIAGWPKGG